MPAGEREERHLDVVREDLARERGARSPASPSSRRGGRGSVTASVLRRDEPGRGAGIADAQAPASSAGAEQERRPRSASSAGRSAIEPPVVRGEEAPNDRVAPGRRVVDEAAAPRPTSSSSRDDERIAGEARRAKREIGGGAAVERAEPQHAVGPEPLRPAPGPRGRAARARPRRRVARRRIGLRSSGWSSRTSSRSRPRRASSSSLRSRASARASRPRSSTCSIQWPILAASSGSCFGVALAASATACGRVAAGPGRLPRHLRLRRRLRGARSGRTPGKG